MSIENGAAEATTSMRTAPSFDEASYLRDNPDVAHAISRGEIASGYAHYIKYGLQEGRVTSPAADEPQNRLVRTASRAFSPHHAQTISQTFEGLIISRGGGVLVIGWIDDAADPLSYIRVSGAGWRLTFGGATLGRSRRYDVEEALRTTLKHPFGYYGFVYTDEPMPTGGVCDVEVGLSSGSKFKLTFDAQVVEDIELRDRLLSAISTADHFGNAHIKAIEGFDRGAGGEILKLNSSITNALVDSPYVERFGARTSGFDGSIVVCLYGKAEFLFLQSALFGAVRGIERYEFIYVSNSPELSETLLREARAATLIYDVTITIVLLSGNAGFGAANNVAASYARSNRIMIVNPDVLPVDSGWAERHSEILRTRPQAETTLFGAALYYDDGSLMHGGMHFELDSAVSLEQGRHRVCQLVRVEHYGKGTPAEFPDFIRPRPVPAVTGAFMSCDRQWYEKLGGFTEDYVFGHYEDADLCLKSLQAGTPVWIHDLKMWHLEGKGSTRLPVHEGGSLINRWLFSLTWGETLIENLLGPNPTHPAYATSGRLPPSPAAATRPSLVGNLR